jgi:SNF2 family DNA or RNA helicase
VPVADQAHVIKNPDTAIAKTAKSIPADFRIAFSGTLVENGLKDMRARFDFVLPGYLGGPAEFKRDFRVPIEVERNKEVADYLKTLTVPFLLRRLKSN